MPNEKFEVKGVSSLVKQLRSLGDEEFTGKTIKSVLSKEAKIIQDAMVAAAPQDTGTMRKFITRASSMKSGNPTVFVGVLRLGKVRFARLGIAAGAYYAKWTERGSKFQRGQHWMSGAVRQTVRSYLDNVKGGLAARIEQRVAQKT